MVAAAKDGVGLDPAGAQVADAVLGGLGLEFAGGGYVGEQGEVDVVDVLAADVVSHLADGFKEGLALDVSDGASDFHHNHVCTRFAGEAEDALLDVVSHVGDGLNGASEEVAAALMGEDGGVDLACSYVGGAGEFQGR